ncbi:MAG: flagellar basal body-associated protein FliL [Sulfitobacter sp.]
MSDAQADVEDAPPKRSKLPIILGLTLALVGGGGGFYATWSGMILSSDSGAEKSTAPTPSSASAEISYVPVDPLVISLRAPAEAQHLKFRAQLEVPTGAEAEVEKLMPRVIDVLNSYLRAIEPGDLEDPAALTRLRAQMLRRVQVVTGLGMVNDLLIMEFVLT